MKRDIQFSDIEYCREDYFQYTHKKYLSGFDVIYHNHDYYEVYILLSGDVRYVIEGKIYQLLPGDIMLINNKDLHKPIITIKEPYERITLSISPDYMQKHYVNSNTLFWCFKESVQKKYSLIKSSNDKSGNIYQVINRLEDEIKNQNFQSEFLINGLIFELMVYLNRAYFEGQTEISGTHVISNEKTDRIVQYINENYGEDLSLDHLSQKFYISKYHLLRQFKKYTGYTVHNFILKKRLLMSKELLQKEQNILKVSMKCGFNDYSNFMRLFKKEFGTTPRQYIISSENTLNN